MELTDEEKVEAKNNGFILVGKTGTGKTTLLNAMFDKVVGKVARTAASVTKETSIYYYKLDNGKCMTFVDTPGLDDAESTVKEDIDLIHLNGISKAISDEKIHIKGILFLVNFQHERFDASEQKALLNYNKIFPLKKFWRHLIVIYTHFYADPDGDETVDEMKASRNETNREIFSQIMEKIKEVSEVIDYNDLKIKYFNSFSEAKNEKQKKKNGQNRTELQILLKELCEAPPLFSQIEIKHIQNYKWEENGKKYYGEVEIIGFFDLNNEPIKERINVIKKEEVKETQNIPPPTYSYHVYNAGYSSNGNLCYNHYNGNESNSKYAKRHTSTGGILGGLTGIGIGSAIGISGLQAGTAITAGVIGSAVAAPVAIGVAVGVAIGALFGSFF